MKITESKLRQMIRGVIREFVSTGTAAGAKRGGYQSADTKTKKSSYDTKKADYDTKKTTATTKKAAIDSSKRFRIANKAKKGTYLYSSTPQRGYTVNPDYTQQVQDKTMADTARDSAKTARDTAKSSWDSAKEADLLKTRVPKGEQVPSMGGGAGFGKGKAAGKGKGKKKKN